VNYHLNFASRKLDHVEKVKNLLEGCMVEYKI
jgi:hypothetical protein